METRLKVSEIPVVGDIGYVPMIYYNVYWRLHKCKCVQLYRKFETRESKKAKLHFVFIDSSNPIAKKDVSDWTEDEWEEAFVFTEEEYNVKFFFNQKKAIESFHLLCGLNTLHKDMAMHCIGLDDDHAKIITRHGVRYFRPIKNRFTAPWDDELWSKLYNCGFASCQIEDKYIDYSLTKLGITWLSTLTNTRISYALAKN